MASTPSPTMMGSLVSKPPFAVAVFSLAAAYVITGRLGLLLAIPPGYATAVWLPSGVALAGVVLFGTRTWPGVWLGSFLVNLWITRDADPNAPIGAAIGPPAAIATGAALQAVVGAFLVRRFIGRENPLSTVGDVCKFLLLAGPVGCLVNATWSVAILELRGIVPVEELLFNWWTWWVGDTIGVIVVTPLAVIWTAQPREEGRRRRLAVGGPLLVACAATVVLFAYARAWEAERMDREFGRRADMLRQNLLAEVTNSLEVLHALAGLFGASSHVEETDFQTVVRQSLKRRGGIQSVSWNPIVRDEDRSAYEGARRREAGGDFQIWESGADGNSVAAAKRVEYFPVHYVEPEELNRTMIGLDAAADPDCRKALRLACDLARPSATRGLTPTGATGAADGFNVFLPVYEDGSTPTTTEDRRSKLRGCISAILRVSGITGAAMKSIETEAMDVEVRDAEAPAEGQLLFTTRATAGESGARMDQALSTSAGAPRLRRTELDVAGRRWTLDVAPTAAFSASQRSWGAWTVLATWMLLAGLLEAFLLVVVGRSAIISQMNRALQATTEGRRVAEEKLQRQALLFNNLYDAVVLTDASGAISDCNAAAERLFGYAAAELVGSNPEILNPPGEGPVVTERIRAAITDQGHWTGEVPVRRKDGAELLCEAAVAPLYDATGRRVGSLSVNRDITERRSAEVRLRSIVDTAVDGIVVIDANGVVQSTNPAVERLFGYKSGELVGRNVNLLMPPPHADQHDRYIAEYLRTGNGKIIGIGREELARRKDGSLFPVDLAVSEMRIGSQRMFTGLIHDLTPRKRADEELAERAMHNALAAEVGIALTESDALHRALQRCAEALVSHLDAAFARIWTIDENTQTLVLQASAGLYTHLDGKHSRIPIGKLKIGWIAQTRRPHMTNDVVGDSQINDHEWARREGMVAFAGHPLVVEDRLVGVVAVFARRTLSEATLEALTTVADGIAIGIERLRAAQALRESERLLQDILDNSMAVIYMKDTHGRYMLINRRYEDLFHVSRTSIVGKTDLEIFPREAAETFMSNDRRVLAGRQPLELEEVAPHDDGPHHYISLKFPLFDSFGVPYGVCGISTDITERKRAEDLEHRHHTELAHASRLGVMGHMVAELVHELAQPLAAVRSYAESGAALLRLRGIDDPEFDRIFRGLSAAADRGSQTVRSFKEFLRKRPPKSEPVNVSQAARDAVRLIEGEAARRGVRVRLDLDDSLPPTQGDRIQIEQVLLNLALNGIQAMDGSPASPRELYIQTLRRDPNLIEVMVSDTGCGVSPEAEDHLFEPFYSTKPDGFGMGLSICRSIVQGMGGGIWAEPNEDRGTRFRFTLPVRSEADSSTP